MRKLSVYIIAKNEARRIRRTLVAARKVADEIVVVDSGSTDDTVKIAEELADRVVYHPWVSYSEQKHYAQELCSNDWVLMDDADEVITDSLADEIVRWKGREDDGTVAYKFKIVSVYPGERGPKRFAECVREIRLYNRKHADLRAEDLTNDRVTVAPGARVGCFRNPVAHFSYMSLEQVIDKLNQYTTESLEKRNGRHYPLIRLFVEGPLNFVRAYLLGRCFLHGVLGFIAAYNYAHFRWVKQAKDYERRIKEKSERI